MYKMLMSLVDAFQRSRPVHECGYAHPDHSASIHYHAGHPRKKRQEFRPGTGPYDDNQRFANTGVPKNPSGTTYADMSRR